MVITATIMKFPILEELGLSPNEAQIYAALLEVNEAGAGAISLKAGVHRRNVYDAIARLVEKGLVYQVHGRGEIHYRAVDPGKLMEFVKEREERLLTAMPELETLYRAQPRTEEAAIYHGIEGMKNYLRDLLRVGEDAYFIGAKGAWFDPRLTTFVQGFLKEASRQNIQFHHIFDADVKKLAPHIPRSVKPPYKFLSKKYGTMSMIDVFGDHVVMFTGMGITQIGDDMTIFVIVSRALADSYRTWFQFMWDQLPDEKG